MLVTGPSTAHTLFERKAGKGGGDGSLSLCFDVQPSVISLCTLFPFCIENESGVGKPKQGWVVPKWEGMRRTERGLFSVQSPPCSLRPCECYGVISHPPFWANNSSPLTIALSQQNAPFNRKKENFGKGKFQKGCNLWPPYDRLKAKFCLTDDGNGVKSMGRQSENRSA